MASDTLLLASQSRGRRELLEQSGIAFRVIQQNADEDLVEKSESFHDYILAIAQHKMNHIELSENAVGGKNTIFVVTADSLTINLSKNTLYGKPKDKEDARQMLAQKRDTMVEVATACCVHKKVFNGVNWVSQDCREWVTTGRLEFFVPDNEVETYLEKVPEALHACGAGIVEGFGLNYVKSVQGSYTAITGLPLYELRQALQSMNFQF